MPDEVQALLRREELQCDRDELDDLVEAARSHRSQKRFQLRKGEFNRIEIRTVGRKESQAGPDAFDRGLHVRLLVDRQVVEDDDIARAQRRDQHLLDIGEKRRIVDRAIENGRRVEPVDAQGRHDGVRLPMPTRGVIAEPQAARAAAVPAEQVGGDAGLIEEDVAARVVHGLRVLPAAPRGGDVSAPLFVGVDGFF
jgi:hypothetical protein